MQVHRDNIPNPGPAYNRKLYVSGRLQKLLKTQPPDTEIVGPDYEHLIHGDDPWMPCLGCSLRNRRTVERPFAKVLTPGWPERALCKDCCTEFGLLDPWKLTEAKQEGEVKRCKVRAAILSYWDAHGRIDYGELSRITGRSRQLIRVQASQLRQFGRLPMESRVNKRAS